MPAVRMTPNPLALIAEITHRCPLHCVYCSNPMEMAAASSELSTEKWIDIFQQSGKLGMLHAHLTGGEPLARPDLTRLIAGAHAAGLYRCRSRSHSVKFSGFSRGLRELDCRRKSSRPQNRIISTHPPPQDCVHRESGNPSAKHRSPRRDDFFHRAAFSRAHGDC